MTAFLRRDGLHLSHRLHMLRRRLRYGQVRSRYLRHGCAPTGSHCEEYVPLASHQQLSVVIAREYLTPCVRHRPRHHGRYHRYLRAGSVGLDIGRLDFNDATVHGLHPTRCRIERGFVRSRRGVCYLSQQEKNTLKHSLRIPRENEWF